MGVVFGTLTGLALSGRRSINCLFLAEHKIGRGLVGFLTDAISGLDGTSKVTDVISMQDDIVGLWLNWISSESESFSGTAMADFRYFLLLCLLMFLSR